MAFCSQCGDQILDTDLFCPGCGSKTGLKIQKEQKRSIRISTAGITLRDIFIAILGGPFLVFGVAFITVMIIGGVVKIPSAFLGAIIGMIFGAIIGMIPFKIGEFVLNRVDDEKTREGALAISMIIGVVIGLSQVPAYLSLLNNFY